MYMDTQLHTLTLGKSFHLTEILLENYCLNKCLFNEGSKGEY